MKTKQQLDNGGFSLIELLLVIVVLGILATIVMASVGGFTVEADSSTCDADRHVLTTSAEAFFAQHRAAEIPPSGIDGDRFERTLVSEQLLRVPSALHDLDSEGRVVAVNDSPCPV